MACQAIQGPPGPVQKVSQRAWGHLGPLLLRPIALSSATFCQSSGEQRMLDPGSFPCSSRLRSKLSPPFSGPPKSPIAAGIRASGLGVRERNDTVNSSPNTAFSPKLGAWPIHSTSFFGSKFNILISFLGRKIGIPFACLHAGSELPNCCVTLERRRCLATIRRG